jgi:hypothetical protein
MENYLSFRALLSACAGITPLITNADIVMEFLNDGTFVCTEDEKRAWVDSICSAEMYGDGPLGLEIVTVGIKTNDSAAVNHGMSCTDSWWPVIDELFVGALKRGYVESAFVFLEFHISYVGKCPRLRIKVKNSEIIPTNGGVDNMEFVEIKHYGIRDLIYVHGHFDGRADRSAYHPYSDEPRALQLFKSLESEKPINPPINPLTNTEFVTLCSRAQIGWAQFKRYALPALREHLIAELATLIADYAFYGVAVHSEGSVSEAEKRNILHYLAAEGVKINDASAEPTNYDCSIGV